MKFSGTTNSPMDGGDACIVGELVDGMVVRRRWWSWRCVRVCVDSGNACVVGELVDGMVVVRRWWSWRCVCVLVVVLMRARWMR